LRALGSRWAGAADGHVHRIEHVGSAAFLHYKPVGSGLSSRGQRSDQLHLGFHQYRQRFACQLKRQLVSPPKVFAGNVKVSADQVSFDLRYLGSLSVGKSRA
jgi:hypothetical protein